MSRSKVYDVDGLTFQGKATGAAARLEGVKKGDVVIAVVEGTLRAVEDTSRAHSSDEIIGKLKVGEVMVLTDEEFAEFSERLSEQRREREVGEGQGQLGEPADEVAFMKAPELKAKCKELGLNPNGKVAELRARLREALRTE